MFMKMLVVEQLPALVNSTSAPKQGRFPFWTQFFSSGEVRDSCMARGVSLPTSTLCFRFLVPKTIPFMVFGTRVLQY